MIYKCKKCNETYPYQPVMCNDCGTMFSPLTFDCKEEDFETGRLIKTNYTREDMQKAFNAGVFLGNSCIEESYENFRSFNPNRDEFDKWIETNL